VLLFRCGWFGDVSVWQVEAACKTNLYCDILGYDTMQFDMYIQALAWKTFPQNYGQNRDIKYTFARSHLTKAMNSKTYGKQLQIENFSAVL